MLRTIQHSRRITLGVWLIAAALGLVLGSGFLLLERSRPAAPSALPPLQGEAAITHPKEPRLEDSLQAAITAARYRVRPSAHAGQAARDYYAANPAQHLTAVFTPQELVLRPQDTDPQRATPWQMGMQLTGYGYDSHLWPVTAGEVAVHGNRVDIHKSTLHPVPSAIVEWYVNQAAGLEQGFTIHQPPPSQGAGEWLRLRLALRGDLHAELAAEGDRLWLKRSDGEVVLNYGGLKAWDASGQELEARMTGAGAVVWLEVAAAGAVYPVIIDPTFTEQQKLTASDGEAEDEFGMAVAISGTTVVIGAPGDIVDNFIARGSAYVFAQQEGQWVEQQKLTASDGAAFDSFGWSVTISGATIVVGAPFDNIGSNDNQGSAYVFTQQGGQWVEQQKLTASDGAAVDQFGIAVAISGATIVVGGWFADIGSNTNQGAAYVFMQQGGQWVEQQKLTASDGAAFDEFGASVAISGATIVVGADRDTIESNDLQGAAYVFTQQGGQWVEQQKLTASDGAAFDQFGTEVAISGARIIVGAVVGDPTLPGSAYVFAP